MGFQVVSRPRRGRSLEGSSAVVRVPAARSRNISVISAMCCRYMLFSKVFDSTVSGDEFKTSFIELLQKCSDLKINNPVFIMDNARIHHYAGVKQLIDERHICVLYLPPYTPMLNPIVSCFSKWKNSVLRGEARTEVQLKNLIDSGFISITEEDCDGYYRKMLRYLVMAEREEEFTQ